MADLAKAGTILTLVGGILNVLGALLMIGMNVLIAWLIANDPGSPEEVEAFIQWIYGSIAALMIVGAILAFIAFSKGRKGEHRTAAILSFVASALPPVQFVMIIAGILLYLADE